MPDDGNISSEEAFARAEVEEPSKSLEDLLYRLRAYMYEEGIAAAGLARRIIDHRHDDIRIDNQALRNAISESRTPNTKTRVVIRQFLDHLKYRCGEPIIPMDLWRPAIDLYAGDVFALNPNTKGFGRTSAARICGSYMYFHASTRHRGRIAVGPFRIEPSYVLTDEGSFDRALIVKQPFHFEHYNETFEGLVVFNNDAPSLAFVMRNAATGSPKLMIQRGDGSVHPLTNEHIADGPIPFLFGENYMLHTWQAGNKSPRHFTGWIIIRSDYLEGLEPNLYKPRELFDRFPQLETLLTERIYTERTVINERPEE